MSGNAASNTPALKTSLPAVHASSSERKPSPNPRHLAIALHHARQIQARKDTEAVILSRIIDLVDLPTTPHATASSPSPEDVQTFTSALVPFQPSDYDNLILERNIEGHCGYTLCPEEHRKEHPTGKFRIVWGPKGSGPNGRGKEMKVVPKEKLEMWCSDKCAERAMYIKVQLSEVPAWERMEKKNTHITLLDESDWASTAAGPHDRTDCEMEGMQQDPSLPVAGEHAHLVQRMGKLAVQDDPTVGGPSPEIIERHQAGSLNPSAPVLRPEDMSGGSIEGFHPNTNLHSARSTEDDNMDMEDILPYT